MAINSEALFSMPGVASGMDWGSMADKIIENESKPIRQWEAQQERLELKIGLYKQLSGLFKTFRSSLSPLKLPSTYTAKAAEFTPLGATSSSAGVMTATATADAAIAQYEIEVAQKAQARRVASGQFSDTSVALGLSGTFSIEMGTLGPVEVTVTTTDSLASVSTKINEAAAAWSSANDEITPFSAFVLDGRIVLTGGLSGAANDMTLSPAVAPPPASILEELGFLDGLGDFNMSLDDAQDAIIVVDGLTVTRETNKITDLIDNVTLDVVGPGKVKLDITLDAQKAVEGVQAFVENYNEIMNWINVRLSEETSKDPASDFEKSWGLLHGDSMLWQAKSSLRSLVANPLNVSFTSRTSQQIYRQFGPLNDDDDEATIKQDTSFVLYHDGRQATIDVKVTDTWNSLAAKINSSVDEKTGVAMSLHASVTEGRLTLRGSKGITVADPGNFLRRTGLRTYSQLAQLGVKTTADNYGKSGELEFSTDDFMAALTENPNQVAELATQLMGKLDAYVGQMVDATTVEVGSTVAIKGKVASQIRSWETQISSLDRRISEFANRLEAKKIRILKQFASAETNLASLNSQLEWLMSINATLSGATK